MYDEDIRKLVNVQVTCLLYDREQKRTKTFT